MDSIEQTALRVQTEKRRHAPETSRVVRCPFGRGVHVEAFEPHGPFELRLEATDGAGSLAAWLDDAWWTDILQRWGDDAVTIISEPTRDALLHPVLLHQLEMLRRVAPGWRIVGVAFRNDFAATDFVAVGTLAAGPYHEVRFVDAVRPARSAEASSASVPTLAELFAAIRAEQERTGRSTPVLVRMPALDA